MMSGNTGTSLLHPRDGMCLLTYRSGRDHFTKLSVHVADGHGLVIPPKSMQYVTLCIFASDLLPNILKHSVLKLFHNFHNMAILTLYVFGRCHITYRSLMAE